MGNGYFEFCADRAGGCAGGGVDPWVGYDLTYWDRQIEALSAEYSVVAFDLPGHGLSAGVPEDYASFERVAEGVSALIEAIQGPISPKNVSLRPVHLVGISFGSMVAQAVVLARPELVRSLTLIGTATTFPEAVRAGMRARAETVRRDGMRAVLATSLDRWFMPETRVRRPDLIDRVTKTVLGDDPAVHAAIWDLIATLDFEERLSENRCPTLLLVGEHDPSTPPAFAERMATKIAEGTARAEVVVVKGASHMTQLEAPGVVNAELGRFLAEM